MRVPRVQAQEGHHPLAATRHRLHAGSIQPVPLILLLLLAVCLQHPTALRLPEPIMIDNNRSSRYRCCSRET
jgi:hypothetical protein